MRTGGGPPAGPVLQVERERLMRSEPELRAAMLNEFARTLREIAGLVAERAGRPADDDVVLALAGAVLGITFAAWLGSVGDDWAAHFLERIDLGMSLLEAGFRL